MHLLHELKLLRDLHVHEGYLVVDDAENVDPSDDLFRRGVNPSCHWTSRHKHMTMKKLAIRRSSHVTLVSHGLSTEN